MMGSAEFSARAELSSIDIEVFQKPDSWCL